MDLFVSNFTNRLDAKGRVSIPAAYRAVLASERFEGVYIHQSLDQHALDCGGNTLLGQIDALLSSLPAYSAERDCAAATLLGMSELLKMDGEGRVILTEPLKAHAGISDHVTFVGLGSKFQIWEPELFRSYLAASRETVRALRKSISSIQPLETS